MESRFPTSAVLAALLVALAIVAPLGAQPRPQRIVSLVPAATEILFAVGAGPRVVGVSSFDKYPEEVATRARVGALVDPDVERILALRPDLVVLYASQEELYEQLRRAGIGAYVVRHGGLREIAAALSELGEAAGEPSRGARERERFERRIAEVRAAVAGRPRPRTLLVFGREPGSLRNVYASGGTGFLHDALVAAGGDNVFADVAREAVQASTELILARRPDAILELRTSPLLTEGSTDPWRRLAAVPAVRAGRVHVLTGDHLVVPGPRMAEVVAELAGVLHPGLKR